MFIAVVMMVAVQIGVAASIFSRWIAGTKHAVAPEAPNSEVGRARSLWTFLKAASAIGDDDICKVNGVDALLAARLCKMRFDAVALWLALAAAPAAVVYAWNPEGSGATMAGISRLSLANTASLGGGSLRARLWVVVYGSYVVLGVGLWLCDRYDAESLSVIVEAVAKAPGHHYVAVVIGLAPPSDDAAVVAKAFSTSRDEDGTSFVLSERDVLAVHLVDGFSLACEAEKRNSPSRLRLRDAEGSDPVLGIHWHDGALLGPWLPWTVADARWTMRRNEHLGLEGAVTNYISALRVATRRDEELLACHKYDGIDRLSRRAREARFYCEKSRAKIAKMVYEKPPSTGVAFVVFRSLAAARLTLDNRSLPNGWLVLPAPEPRDIIWENLERAAVGSDGNRDNCPFMLRVSILLFGATLFLTGIAIFAHTISIPPSNVMAVMMAEVLPAIVFGNVVTFVITVGIHRLHYLYGPKSEVWARSRIEARTLLDGGFFVSVITVIIPSVSAVIIAAAKIRESINDDIEIGNDRSDVDVEYVAPRILRVAAILELPTMGMVIASVVLLRIGDLGVTALRVGPYLHFLRAKRVQEYRHSDLLKKSRKDYRNLTMPPEPVNYASWATWEVFAMASAAAYAPIAPMVVFVAVIFLGCALTALRLNLATTTTTTFNVDGALSRPGIVATQAALVLAFLLHTIVVVVCGAMFQFLVLLPLAGLAVVFATRSKRRWCDESRTLHYSALCFGRLGLNAAEDVDAKRFPNDAARNCAAFCCADRLWTSRVAPPIGFAAHGHGLEKGYTAICTASRHLTGMNADLDFFPGMASLDDHEDLDDRVEPMVIWIDRYDAKTAVPTFFTVDDRNEDLVFKNLTLVRIADGTWRKMKDQRKKRRHERLLSLRARLCQSE